MLLTFVILTKTETQVKSLRQTGTV